MKKGARVGRKQVAVSMPQKKAAAKPFPTVTQRKYASNTLIQSATQTDDRKSISPADYDLHRVVSPTGRRNLLTVGRWVFMNFPSVQGMVYEQANLAVGTFIPQFKGEDKAWGELAEQRLREWHNVMDVAGWPYGLDAYLQNQIVQPLVDGEIFTLLTEDGNGNPRIQQIPSHRIGSRFCYDTTAKVRLEADKLFIDDVLIDQGRPTELTSTVEFEAQMVDGVIVDAYGRAIAYRVYDDSLSSATYRDFSSRSLFPTFCPIMPGQVRGLSMLASSIANWQDVKERRGFEMLAQKVFSSRVIVEHNETGDADSAQQIIKNAATFNADGSQATPATQTIAGGTLTYMKANSGSKLEAFDWDRPTANAQAFEESIMRDAFRGAEWEIDFSLDASKVGGASMRVVMEKINATLKKRRRMVEPTMRRVDGYAVAKMIQRGELPPNKDWWRWEYQGPGDLTADRMYDSQVDIQEIFSGLGTRENAIARRGGNGQEVRDQLFKEADEKLQDAANLAKKHGVTTEVALVVMGMPQPNQQLPQAQQKPQNPGEKP